MMLGLSPSRTLVTGCLLGLLAAGCGKAPATREAPKVPAALQGNVLAAVPSDIQHRLFIDFDGKVHLLGYNIEPRGVVPPGQKFKLTMYWQPVARLGPGWKLFTHILDDSGRFVLNDDNLGPLRELKNGNQALPPSDWQPGKVYVDEQEIEVPTKVDSPGIDVRVGIWHEGAPHQSGLRLEILSGPTDGQNRAIIVHVKTGLVPPKAAPKRPARKS